MGHLRSADIPIPWPCETETLSGSIARNPLGRKTLGPPVGNARPPGALIFPDAL